MVLQFSDHPVALSWTLLNKLCPIVCGIPNAISPALHLVQRIISLKFCTVGTAATVLSHVYRNIEFVTNICSNSDRKIQIKLNEKWDSWSRNQVLFRRRCCFGPVRNHDLKTYLLSRLFHWGNHSIYHEYCHEYYITKKTWSKPRFRYMTSVANINVTIKIKINSFHSAFS